MECLELINATEQDKLSRVSIRALADVSSTTGMKIREQLSVNMEQALVGRI